jgi:hypothetical protein
MSLDLLFCVLLVVCAGAAEETCAAGDCPGAEAIFTDGCTSAKLSKNKKGALWSDFKQGTWLIGHTPLKMDSTVTLTLFKANFLPTAYIGVCVEGYDRETKPVGKGAWTLNSDGSLRNNGNSTTEFVPNFHQKGATVTVRYKPAEQKAIWTFSEGTAEQKQVVVKNIDTEEKGVRFCVGSNGANEWRLV